MLPHQTPVRRILSETPLARSYELSLLGDARKRRVIPWQAFDRSRYPDAALELAGDAHARLAEGEYHAVGLFGRISSGIAMVPAPFDIVAASTRISSDEIRHADYCTRFASLCTGHEVTLAVDRGALAAAAPALPDLNEADFLVAKYAATGETLAAALLLACRKRAKDPLARALFSSLLGDEVAHARFGWYYLAWRAPRWTQTERQIVADHLGEFVASIERALWFGRDAPASARAAADALGVLDSESQREVVRQVMEEEIVPGLDALGLGASHAWRVRARGAASVPRAFGREELVFGGGKPVAARPERATDSTTQVVDRAAAWLAARVTD
ncbi:MAG TPA: ferritin-like domain-containing protein, partial [Polyangiaceae bacterium]|nr:ferritin-like domain-containing protein [Polyangiaceae bacterium]